MAQAINVKDVGINKANLYVLLRRFTKYIKINDRSITAIVNKHNLVLKQIL